MRALTLLILIQFLVLLPCSQVKAQDADAAAIHEVTLSNYPELSQLSKEEKKWFRVFQEGNFLADGWKQITEKILAQTPVEQREERRIELEELGCKIGLEWSKSNDIRKVDTRMLQEWGGKLKKVAKKNPEQIPDLIVSINKEVDQILD